MTPSTSKKIFKKYFSSNNSSLFFNEIYWLKKFENYEFVPRIIDINYKKYIYILSLYFTYLFWAFSNANF